MASGYPTAGLGIQMPNSCPIVLTPQSDTAGNTPGACNLSNKLLGTEESLYLIFSVFRIDTMLTPWGDAQGTDNATVNSVLLSLVEQQRAASLVPTLFPVSPE